MRPDLTIIIRATGERTERACKIIAEQQAGTSVEVVRRRPFWQALKFSMEAGLDAASKWTLILDADILLATNAVPAMIAEMEEADVTNFYMTDFMLLDRGFGGPAYGGVHGYRTALFDKAMQWLEAAANEVRPETYVCKQMAACGFPFRQPPLIVGLHDYEQYYCDLYRKSVVRSYKFRGLWRYVLDRCRRQYSDDDFKVILWGFLDGLQEGMNGGKITLDSLAYRCQSKELMEIRGIAEKPPLEETDKIIQLPVETLKEYRPDDLYMSHMANFSSHPYRIIRSATGEAGERGGSSHVRADHQTL
ncbi:MAG: hypothetical protein MOB07_05725 [Acidobacteria bacterium]|nr:hypothetical protein [Acidobacteriota bacterium]